MTELTLKCHSLTFTSTPPLALHNKRIKGFLFVLRNKRKKIRGGPESSAVKVFATKIDDPSSVLEIQRVESTNSCILSSDIQTHVEHTHACVHPRTHAHTHTKINVKKKREEKEMTVFNVDVPILIN